MSHLKDGLGSVALDIVPVDDDLDDTVPNLLTDVVACDADQVEDGVHIPCVVDGVLLREDGHFEHLTDGGRETNLLESERNTTHRRIS